MLLAFDTATPQVTVALHDGDDVVAEVVSDRTMKHGEQLAPLISEVLGTAGIVRQDLTAVAVGAGPGPFTGLRVGLVTARTLGFALEIPIYAACSLDVLAVEAVASGVVSTSSTTGVSSFFVATDARRKEVYLASYDEDGARLEGPVVARPAEVATSAPVVGEGARLYPDAFPTPVGPQRPSAGWLARAVAEERVELMDPEPLYLRRPDAIEQAALKKQKAPTKPVNPR
ncbi:tRNA threonylcarbamoyl adenosine modification protein YeaZ [Nocardioides luteus]|uniref:tRNA (Adenosine(37)-N6)-threonylcarbamoyltransferase complex dimerization subunit type 1 TsaB n=1 Tax=Nocardioides luteus TaxID=1844 RepID=A0ABQ5T3T9_9ACTN|nr:tRNA (adenosine(37)-N6)-threonylcarbamoyltransferase complex dimerization subunit type 1 TsaB [Nocardioides luteus]MDR7313754.1 tRNA threonylcarbamoyl adenosine modification protein YeaZ [Nocardioides luteus]GGR63601.1 tRNA (adenosine(37)-N6)-threonylcarbamoyltransferase complex dimerization subunit type 1 TsaB [Nocardioides luteus]GLJ70397.1 tRNA (adenosine(37)-N6)-threonylcarbamoyltransferase complex dimerization subunit type 1 TsaB [Nocardioides luteus]